MVVIGYAIDTLLHTDFTEILHAKLFFTVVFSVAICAASTFPPGKMGRRAAKNENI
jgi:hypothetical protein